MREETEQIKILLARKNKVDFCEYVFGWDVQKFQEEWYAEAKRHKRLLIFASVEHGKSSHFSVADNLWDIGDNPSIRIALICNSGGQARKFFGLIREVIEGDTEVSKRYRRVFPGVKRGTGVYRRWDSEAIIVERPDKATADFTMIAIGTGKKFLGARFDKIVFDDWLDFDNTLTVGQRDKVWSWLRNTALTRLTKNGRAIAITTAWNNEDSAHLMEASGAWHCIRTPAIEVTPDGSPIWDGKIAWPDSWPIERLREKNREVGSIEFSRQFLCRAVSDALSRFNNSSIQHALTMGKTHSIVERFGTEAGEAFPIFAGVDLAVGKREEHDQTAIFVGCVIPASPTPKRLILNIIMGRMEGEEILDQLALVKYNYPKIVGVFVEDNAAQSYLVQFARKREGLPPIRGFTTTAQKKYDPKYGIPGLSVELDAGDWIFPSKEREQQNGELNPKIVHLITGLRTWNPRDHTADDVIAMWLFREAVVGLYGVEIKTGGIQYDFAKDQSKGFYGPASTNAPSFYNQ